MKNEYEACKHCHGTGMVDVSWKKAEIAYRRQMGYIYPEDLTNYENVRALDYVGEDGIVRYPGCVGD